MLALSVISASLWVACRIASWNARSASRPLEGELDLLLRHHDPRPNLACDDLQPGDLGPELIAQGAWFDVAGGEIAQEGLPVRVVAAGDGVQGLVDLGFGDVQSQPSRLLQLQLLVDESTQDLWGEPLLGLGVVGQAARGDRKVEPVDQILTRDHVVVDDGRDALGHGLCRDARGETADQQEGHQHGPRPGHRL